MTGTISGKIRHPLQIEPTLNINNEIFYDNEQLNKSELVSVLLEEVKNNPNTTFLVRADQDLPYKDVMSLMRILDGTLFV